MKYFLLLLLSILACTAKAESPELQLSLWSEFVPYSIIHDLLPEVSKRHLTLNVAVHADHPNYDEFFQLYIEAWTQGVKIRPWLLLGHNDGYGFNKWNFKASNAFVNEFVSEAEKRKIKIDWLVFDLEAPAEFTIKLSKLIQHWHFIGLMRSLRDSAHESSLSEASKSYTLLLDQMHRKAIRVMAVTSNFVLNDLQDDSKRIQNALGLPVETVQWDEISFKVYRFDFEYLLMGNMSPWIVNEYGRRALDHFGSRASLGVGQIGKVTYPAPFQGYSDSIKLQEDIGAANAAGIADVHIYSLDGMLEKGLSGWTTTPNTEKPVADLKSKFLLFIIDMGRYLLPKA